MIKQLFHIYWKSICCGIFISIILHFISIYFVQDKNNEMAMLILLVDPFSFMIAAIFNAWFEFSFVDVQQEMYFLLIFRLIFWIMLFCLIKAFFVK